MDFLLPTIEDRQTRIISPGHRPGVLGTPGRPAGFQKTQVVFFSCALSAPKMNAAGNGKTSHMGQITGHFLELKPFKTPAISSEAESNQLGKEKRAQRLTIWVRRWLGGVGVSHAKGWSKTSLPGNLFSLGVHAREHGMSWEFCRDVPEPLGGFQKVSAGH